ncbi:MAG: DciA family protein [Candidatus Saganbacteria bacterium]|nr:DciA family protein [Candidatus Saganbacteria bacterium]
MIETAKEALAGLVKKNPALDRKLKSYGALDVWDKNIDASGKSWAERISKGVLFIVTENPSLSQEIVFHKNGSIKKINDELGETVVKDIKVRIGCKKEKERN